MKKLLVFLTLVAIGFAVWWFGFRKSEADIPGIDIKLKNEGNAADFYVKIINSLQRRKAKDLTPTLTRQELVWFIEGTSIRPCRFHPDHFKPTVSPVAVYPEHREYRRIARAVVKEAKKLRTRNAKKAEELLKRIVVFGEHIFREEDSLVEMLVGQFVRNIIGYGSLVKHFEAIGDESKRQYYKKINDKFEKQAKELLRKLQRGLHSDDFDILTRIYQNESKPLWRKEALSSLLNVYRKEPTQANAKRIYEFYVKANKEDEDATVRKMAENCAKMLIRYVKYPSTLQKEYEAMKQMWNRIEKLRKEK